jgi:hypothetical protein
VVVAARPPHTPTPHQPFPSSLPVVTSATTSSSHPTLLVLATRRERHLSSSRLVNAIVRTRRRHRFFPVWVKTVAFARNEGRHDQHQPSRHRISDGARTAAQPHTRTHDRPTALPPSRPPPSLCPSRAPIRPIHHPLVTVFLREEVLERFRLLRTARPASPPPATSTPPPTLLHTSLPPQTPSSYAARQPCCSTLGPAIVGGPIIRPLPLH